MRKKFILLVSSDPELHNLLLRLDYEVVVIEEAEQLRHIVNDDWLRTRFPIVLFDSDNEKIQIKEFLEEGQRSTIPREMAFIVLTTSFDEAIEGVKGARFTLPYQLYQTIKRCLQPLY